MRYRRRYGCNWVVKWLYASLFAALAVGCGGETPSRDQSWSGVVRTPDKGARPLAPLSGSISGSRRPVFSFTPAPAARVEICYERSCAHLLETLHADDGLAQPGTPLPAGTLFWRVVAGDSPSAVWQLVIPSRDSGLPTAFGTVPDYDGDGFADVAVGAPADGTGSVPLFLGRFLAPGTTPDATLMGGDRFGRAIGAVGDVNGDGLVDLAVASGCDPGWVTIYHGAPAGPRMAVTLPPGPVTAAFGATMAGAGDVNGDGYGDVLVGGQEVAQLFLGGPSGVVTTPVLSLAGAADHARVVQGPGDVNGDGAPDVYVSGAVYLGGGGFTRQGPVTAGPSAGFAGDHDGDGLTDLAAGDPGVLPGSPAGVDPTRFLLQQAGEQLFASAGDVDGDGYTDVLASLSSRVGAPERERVFFGAGTACATTDCRAFTPLFIPGHDQVGGNLLAIIAAAGDLNGDGGDDLVVATPENGTVYVHTGGGARELPLRAPFPTLTGAAGFGSSLASLFGTAPVSP